MQAREGKNKNPINSSTLMIDDCSQGQALTSPLREAERKSLSSS